MYEIVEQIINHVWTTGDSSQQYIMYVCCALVVLFAIVFIDMIRDIFHAFFRG